MNRIQRMRQGYDLSWIIVFGIIAAVVVAALLSSCSVENRIYEDTLYVTKKYVGDFIHLEPGKRETNIVTTNETFFITGTPELSIPVNARCYVKYSAESKAGTMRTFWILYFTWDGTEDMFMVRQNYITGNTY